MEYINTLKLIESLVAKKKRISLTDLQRAILSDCWANPRITYETIAIKQGYSVKYIKQDVGPKLWQLLSEICEEKVKKNNFRSAIERLAVDRNTRDRDVFVNDSPMKQQVLRQSNHQDNRGALNTVSISQTITKKNSINLTEAPDVSVLFGRAGDMKILSQISARESSNLAIILGMGGIGKTQLAAKLVQEVKHSYDYVFWKSLTYDASYEKFMLDLLTFLAQNSLSYIPTDYQKQLDLLTNYLRQHRCLIVLDNLETILAYYQIGSSYQAGYEKYGKLIEIVSQYNHHSLLLITSREKPRHINAKQDRKVHCYYLSGLDANAGRELLQSHGCIWNCESDCNYLLAQYAGNPLALNFASSTIQYLFEGNLTNFIAEETFVLSGIDTLLKQQIERLPSSCKTIVYWLTIFVNPTSIKRLKNYCHPKLSNHELIDSLETLLRRGIIEKNVADYRLQPMIREYLEEQIVKICYQEILEGELVFLNTHALRQIDSEEHVKAYQQESIIKPLLNRCLDSFNGIYNLVSKLDCIVTKLQLNYALSPGYAVGNVINLLCQLKVSLAGKDFSNLTIWQADLRKVDLHQVNFSGSDLGGSVFSEELTNILSLDFSPNGELLATGDFSGQVKLWSIEERRLKQIYAHHIGSVQSVAFSSDGQFLAIGCSDSTVGIWSVKTNCLVRKLTGHGQQVRCVVFSPCGKFIATSSSDHKIKLWLVATGRCWQTLIGHTDRVWSLSFHSDGKTLASGSEDRTIKLWSIDTGKCIKSFIAHRKWIRTIAFHPQKNVLISGGGDCIIKQWDLDNGKCINTLVGHTQRIRSVAFSPDGQTIVSGSGDRTIRFWNYQTGECKQVLHGHNGRLTTVAFDRSGQILASSGEDKSIRLWNVATGKLFHTWQGCSSWFESVAFSPDGGKLISGGENHQIEMWDLSQNSFSPLLKLIGHQGWVHQVAFSPQQDKIVSCSSDRTIKLWDANTGDCLNSYLGHSHWVRSVVFSPSGKILASGGGDNVVKIWNIAEADCQQSLFGHQGWISSVAFSPDNIMVASGSKDKTICLWNLLEGKLEKILTGHTSWVQSVAFSPDGLIIASGSCDGTLKLWSVETGECLQTFREHTSWVQSVVFSPDGLTIASGSCDRTLKLWSVETEECLQTFKGHTSWIQSVAFSPDGLTIASGSQDESIKLWNISRQVCCQTFNKKRLLEGTNIEGIKGINSAQVDTLVALGARFTVTNWGRSTENSVGVTERIVC